MNKSRPISREDFILIKELYDCGVNVTETLRSMDLEINSDIIELVYDLQSGSYTREWEKSPNAKEMFAQEICNIVSPYIQQGDILVDAGIGEATSLIPIIKNLNRDLRILAFDLSWSRLTWAQENLLKHSLQAKLAVADLNAIPLSDNSVDHIMSIHAIEPNGGCENEILDEFSRVTSNSIFLIEPDWDNASFEQRARMKSLCYIESLEPAIQKCNLEIIDRVQIANNSNALNAASIFVLKKQSSTRQEVKSEWVDPIAKEELTAFESGYRTKSGLLYPQIAQIPFLRPKDVKYGLNPSTLVSIPIA